jgi:hypothetical protein
MARSHNNDPISHCPGGQGGRTFSRLKPGNGVGLRSSERRGLRQKLQPVPSGKERFPFGKYYDWDLDPDNNNTELGVLRPELYGKHTNRS